MCCCTNNPTARPALAPGSSRPDAVVLRVDGMTCGHCVRAVTAAIERDLPGVGASVDLATKTLTVSGTTDAVAVARAVVSAGYKPVQAG
ncbi:heavy-metal-associated domain-containing protein [Methylorubrum thiocyanatum]|uniref:heavy-metal-associated domain-containing protein n=1 Tax=Methylorubrum thiocyanatum TaxID=47958 RepID=UPI0035C7E77F